MFGNTSKGIFKDDPSTVFVDMSNVPELQVVQVTSSGITVGAATSIANLISILEANAGMSQSYPVLVEHLSIVANVAVRNAGCWAGNLMLTHNNPDFPSDIFTIMAATNATLTIASSGGSQTYDLFSFLQLDMTNYVIVSITIPVLAAGQKLATFKIMPRHINSHAYVNAGLLMAVDANNNGLLLWCVGSSHGALQWWARRALCTAALVRMLCWPARPRSPLLDRTSTASPRCQMPWWRCRVSLCPTSPRSRPRQPTVCPWPARCSTSST